MRHVAERKWQVPLLHGRAQRANVPKEQLACRGEREQRCNDGWRSHRYGTECKRRRRRRRMRDSGGGEACSSRRQQRCSRQGAWRAQVAYVSGVGGHRVK